MVAMLTPRSIAALAVQFQVKISTTIFPLLHFKNIHLRLSPEKKSKFYLFTIFTQIIIIHLDYVSELTISTIAAVLKKILIFSAIVARFSKL